ncbi:ribonuclease G [Aquicoccus sp. SCR17]|nr:ribonuclease G [Carideicomes alvinocaridis]
MKGTTIILDQFEGREAAALMIDGRLEDLLVDSDGTAPGTIYRAVPDRPVKGQGGVFCRTPDGSVFLRQIKGLSPGRPLLVQVTGHAEPGKAPVVSPRVLFKSRYAIVTPEAPGLNVSRSIRDDDRRDTLLEIAHETGVPEGMGLILRSSCAEADEAEIAEDIRAMSDLAAQVMADTEGGPEKLVDGDGPHALAWRDWTMQAEVETAPGGFETHGVLDEIETLRSPYVPLSGGASAYVEPTRALVAVDVNTGASGSAASGLRANLALARELPRQLRLRGLAGQVVVDPAPMPHKDRKQVEGALRKALREDPVETTLVGWTTLGHMELQRQRLRAPLFGWSTP